MAVPKHKRYKKSSNLFFVNLFSVTKRPSCPAVLNYFFSLRPCNQIFYVVAGDDYTETPVINLSPFLFLHNNTHVGLNLVDPMTDETWAGLFSFMTSSDFAVVKKATLPTMAYSCSPYSPFPPALYLSSWELRKGFYKFFVSYLDSTVTNFLREGNTSAPVAVDVFFRKFYASQTSKLDSYAPFTHLPLVLLAY